MLIPPAGSMAGEGDDTIGDDIAWIKPAPMAICMRSTREAGYFGVAPGTSYESNPNAMKTLERDVIFTNVALTEDGDVWWGRHDARAAGTPHRLAGQSWTPGVGARLRIPMRVYRRWHALPSL